MLQKKESLEQVNFLVSLRVLGGFLLNYSDFTQDVKGIQQVYLLRGTNCKTENKKLGRASKRQK